MLSFSLPPAPQLGERKSCSVHGHCVALLQADYYVRLICLLYVFDDMVVIVIALMCKVTYLNTRELLF